MTTFKPTQYGKYLLLDRIDCGGMAELFRGKILGSQGFEKLVAIKKILPHLANQDEFVKAFIDEARLAAFLQHPNIVQIYDFGQMEDSYFISMEYLSGTTLKAVLQKAEETGKPLKLPLSLFYILPMVCEGLNYAHNLKDLSGTPLNIIHRDIGPQNIFITFDGEVKLIDFGIAKASSHDATTYAGSLKGKLAYMSPEQASGQEIDLRSDLFSVGILLYELATGTRLYTGETQKILALASKGQFKPAEEVKQGLPVLLYNIIRKSLALNPDDRYQSAAELRLDLDKCADELAVRLSTRHMAGYMQDLFKDESLREERALRHAAEVESSSQFPAISEPTLPGGPEDKTLFETKSPQRPTAKQLSILAALLLTLTLAAIFSIDTPITKRLRAHIPTISWPTNWFNSTIDHVVKSSSKVEDSLHNRLNNISATVKESQQKQPAISPLDRHGAARQYLASVRDANDPTALADKEMFDQQISYLIMEYPEEAREILQTLAIQYPNQAIVHFQLGRLHWNMDEPQQAMDSYRKAIEIDGKMDRALFNLGLLFVQENNIDKALALFDKVVELKPAYIDEVLFNMAVLYRRKGEHGKSLQLLQQAVGYNPHNERAVKLLAKIRRNG